MVARVTRGLLPALIEHFKGYSPESITLCGLLSTILECGTDKWGIWSDQLPDARSVLLCPPQSPDEKMPFIARIRFLFAIDTDSAKNLLTERNVFQGWDTIEFEGLREMLWPVVQEVAAANGFKADVPLVGHLYYVPDGKLAESPPVPEGFELGCLAAHHGPTVTSTWAYGNSPELVAFIQGCIRLYPSMALFEKRSGDMVAFALTYTDGALGNLFVIPSYRGRGFGKLVMSRLAHVIHGRGRLPFLYIVEGNEKSIALHKKLGFVVSSEEKVSWTRFERQ